MSDSPKIGNITGVSALGGLFVLLATNGTKFWEGMDAAWKFLLTISKTAPLGVGSFFMALASATMITIACRHYLPESKNKDKRALGIELLAVVVALLVAFTQLSGLAAWLVGGGAGLSASLLARSIMALATWIGRRLDAAKSEETLP
jgi:hypothetical protein